MVEVTDRTQLPLQGQTTFAEFHDHQASAGSSNPLWATPSAKTTSDEEDALDLPDFRTTTPEPIDEKASSLSTSGHHPETTLATSFLYQQSTGILDSYSASTMYKPTSNHLKRKAPSDSLSAYMSPAKMTKTSSLPQLHDTHFDHHTLQPANCPPLTSTYNTRISTLPQRPTTTQPLHLSIPSQTAQHTHFSSHGMHASFLNTPTHQTVRPRKPPLPITDSSGIKDWALVDTALHTQIAASRHLPRSGPRPAPWEPETAMRGRASGVCIPLMQFADLEKRSKGKACGVSGWTAPRWSNVGEFKARLDMMYGPGDINRGLGRGPKNIQASSVESDIAPEQPALVGLRDPEAAQGSALTEDEDDPEILPRVALPIPTIIEGWMRPSHMFLLAPVGTTPRYHVVRANDASVVSYVGCGMSRPMRWRSKQARCEAARHGGGKRTRTGQCTGDCGMSCVTGCYMTASRCVTVEEGAVFCGHHDQHLVVLVIIAASDPCPLTTLNMLALAPQPMHTPVDVPHRAQPPTPGSSTRPTFRKVTPSYTSASSSSHSTHSSHSGSHPSHHAPLEVASSSRRATPQRTPPFASNARATVYDGHEDDPSTPPGSESEDNEPEMAMHSNPAPVDIHSYDSTTLLRLLANALTEIAAMNTDRDQSEPYLSSSSAHSHASPSEPHPPIWRTLTTASRHALSTASSLSFHARNVPTIALEAYLTRIQKYCPASNEVFLSLLVYFDRMMKLAKEACGKVFAIDMYNVHRLVIAGVTVASKFFSDVFYTNSRYAKVGGLPLTELNQLELQFLLLNNFHLMISQEEMQFYASKLVQQSQVPPGVSLLPFLPDCSSAPYDFRRSPVGPVKYFAALDGYITHLHARARPSQRDSSVHAHTPSYTPSSSRPTSEYRRSTSSYSASSTSDAVTDSGDTETDFDGETDDEPTIRAPHSSASSETMSASDADSIYTDDDRSETGEHAHPHSHSNGARTGDYHHRDMMSP